MEEYEGLNIDKLEEYAGLTIKKLDEIINKINFVRVASIGDLCLDVYWTADMTKSNLSRETPHFPLPIVEERMYPGGSGNVASNIAALKPYHLDVLGVSGKDWRGDMLIRKLQESSINTDVIIRSEKVSTNAYCKPVRKGISNVEYEDQRIDFNNYTPLPQELEEQLLHQLEIVMDRTDVLCVSDQFTFGCITPAIRKKINYYGHSGKKIIVDSRDKIGEYKNVILKPNEIEGYHAAYNKPSPKNIRFEEYIAAAKLLSSKNHSSVCMTLGSNGCIFTNLKSVVHIPSYPILQPIDFCGAGDTFLSAFSCALATNAEPWEAASFANMAAEVAIKKIGITGTASSDEIKARYDEIGGLRI